MMKWIWRYLVFPVELIVYGLSYAYLQFLIRSPRPLDPEWTWHKITSDGPPLLDWFRRHYPPRFVRGWLLAAKIRQDILSGIAYHYDVSNDFYRLFLDQDYMFYTCADFHSEDDTIEQAQRHKADFLLGLIEPHAGEKILDLGCGWGSMMKRIFEVTGDKENLYGWTLSKEQVEYNKQHDGFNIEFRNFVTTEYPPEFFDKVYSIGSWEAVRPQEVRPTLQKINGTLKPGGRLVKHFFCRVEEGLFASAACGQIFFPGHLGSSYRAQLDAFEAAGFKIKQRTIHDYRPTLRAWFDNLVRNQEAALKIVDLKTYNRYIVFFPTSWRYFQDGRGMLIRWVAEKQGRPAPSEPATEPPMTVSAG